jgi:integrase/recombinase XerD
MEMNQIRLSHLRKWIDYVIKKNPSPYTIWTKVVIARTFFNWCVREGFLKTSPAQRLDKPWLPQRIPKASTDQEIQALLRAAEESEICPERDTALVYFFLETGARRSAVAGLKLCDLSLQERVAVVITKGDKEVRPPSDHQSVFGLTSDGIYRVIIRLKTSAGIERSICPHVLRHTSATLRVEQGIDSSSLQQIMGWNDIRMAEVYTGLANERLKRRALETSPMDNILNIATHSL